MGVILDGRWIHLIHKENKMRLTPPTKNVFYVSVAVAVVALIAQFGVIGFLAPFAFWLALAAFVLLALGVALKGF